MMTEIAVSLFNFQSGGRKAPGSYDFGKLLAAFKHVSRTPDLIVLCEAKEWGFWGQGPLLEATSVLEDHFKVPYQAKLTHISRGEFSPALLFNPNVFGLSYWGNPHLSVPEDKRNLVGLVMRDTKQKLEAVPEHWDYASGRARMPYAERIASYGKKGVPVLIAGDINETASGLHLPQIDWSKASATVKKHKGKKLADGSYGPHTDAIDWLIGSWDERFPWGHQKAQRLESAGFHLVAELAAKSGTPLAHAFTPTTKDGFLIDMLLINDAWLRIGGVKPKTYRVIGADVPNWPSDHYIVEVVLTL